MGVRVGSEGCEGERVRGCESGEVSRLERATALDPTCPRPTAHPALDPPPTALPPTTYPYGLPTPSRLQP